MPAVVTLGGMTWTAPEVKRSEPGLALPERESLEAWLEYHRETLLWKCAGLSAEQLKMRPVPPSRLSLLGLVRHMAEVECWWFSMHAGETTLPLPYSSEGNNEADFDDLDDADAASDIETFWREVDASRAAVRDRGLDDYVGSRGHDPRKGFNIRWIFVHMIEEYARHNGHADLIRECIDGATGD